MNIGIVGLGLIGGSFARAIKRHTEHTILGMDVSDEVVLKARLVQVIDGDLTQESLAQCDMLLLAIVPSATISFLQEQAPRLAGTTVVDCCGVKRAIMDVASPLAQAYGFDFIGGHPMAGREYSGFEYSLVNLFDGASMILTPPAGVDIMLLDRLRRFFLSLGFTSVQMSEADEHDRIIAYTSQLAHVLSSAYVKSEAALQHRGFSAGSFEDMTRVALLNEAMWTELFCANSDYLSAEAEALAERLTRFAHAIRAGDERQVRELLSEGRERKQLLMAMQTEGQQP
jgi:prephenate dehydrogenase